MKNQTIERLKNYLTMFGRKYPNAWRQFDEFRAMRGSSGFEWHDWCFCPLAASYAIVSGGGAMPFQLAGDVGVLGGLAAWRATQGIYRFDTEVFAAVWETPVAGDIPVEVLYRLPEWCCYIETPGKQFGGDEIYGFFVYLDDDRQNLRDELRFVFDTKSGLIPYPVHLQKTGLAESLESVAREAKFQAESAGKSFSQSLAIITELKANLEPLLSLTLYLCAQADSEFRDLDALPQPDYNPRTKRIYPPNEPRRWEIGYRIGAAIRKARTESASDAGFARLQVGGRKSVRPHVRRAHWHGFWTGERTGKQKFILKWLPPIPVKVEDDNPVIPTIKEIKKNEREN